MERIDTRQAARSATADVQRIPVLTALGALFSRTARTDKPVNANGTSKYPVTQRPLDSMRDLVCLVTSKFCCPTT